MPKPRVRIRLWMLLALVALAAVGLAAQKWWRDRQELLRMAEWHERIASRLQGHMSLVARDPHDHFAQELEQAQPPEKTRQQLRDYFSKEKKAIPEFAAGPLVTEEQLARRRQKIELDTYHAVNELWNEMLGWHNRRAKQMRAKWVFDLKQERAEDERFGKNLRARWKRSLEGCNESIMALHRQLAADEEAYAAKLSKELGPKVNDPRTVEAARVSYHSKKAAEYLDDSTTSMAQFWNDFALKSAADFWIDFTVPPAPPSKDAQKRTSSASRAGASRGGSSGKKTEPAATVP